MLKRERVNKKLSADVFIRGLFSCLCVSKCFNRKCERVISRQSNSKASKTCEPFISCIHCSKLILTILIQNKLSKFLFLMLVFFIYKIYIFIMYIKNKITRFICAIYIGIKKLLQSYCTIWTLEVFKQIFELILNF